MSQLVPSSTNNIVPFEDVASLHNDALSKGFDGREKWFASADLPTPWSDLAALCNALGWTVAGAEEVGLPVECLISCKSCEEIFNVEGQREYYSDDFCSHCVRNAEEERLIGLYLRRREHTRQYQAAYTNRLKRESAL